ncbi:MAG: AI-2E family transporter [Faecousia sp.]
MDKSDKRRYLYAMLAGFGSISLSVVLFFILYGMKNISDALKTLCDILSPFIYGGVMAYLLRPLCNHYETFFRELLPGKAKRAAGAVAVGLSLVTGLLIVYALIIMIAPQLYESIKSIWETLPGKINQLIDWLTRTFGEDEVLLRYMESAYQTLYTQLDQWARETLVPSISNLVSGVGMSVWRVLLFLKNLLIGLIVAVYLLASRKKFKRQSVLILRSALKPRWAELVLQEIAFVDKMFGGFIDGKIMDSAIMGVLCYIGCIIFRFPNALLISAIVGITNVIPFFGPFIGAIPSVLLILMESPIKALWFAVFILALQQLDGNVIGPKILGDRTGLSSFWVLFSIILFGGLWGLVGMVVCVPLFAVIYDIIKKLVQRGLEKNGMQEAWEQYKADYPDDLPEKHTRG